MTTEITIVRTYIPLHQRMCNRFPLQPSRGVGVREVRQINIRRQFDVLTGEVLFIDIRPLGKSRQLLRRGDEIRIGLRSRTVEGFVTCTVPVRLRMHRRSDKQHSNRHQQSQC